jgi:hypothetical protein
MLRIVVVVVVVVAETDTNGTRFSQRDSVTSRRADHERLVSSIETPSPTSRLLLIPVTQSIVHRPAPKRVASKSMGGVSIFLVLRHVAVKPELVPRDRSAFAHLLARQLADVQRSSAARGRMLDAFAGTNTVPLMAAGSPWTK